MRGSRAINVRTVDHFRVIEGIGVGGATEKDILEDPETGKRYIAKLGGRNSDVEVMTEYAIHIIGRSLNVLVANAMIARFRGRLRFLSEYFLADDQELVHGMQLFADLYDEATVRRVVGDECLEQQMFNVQAVKAAFGAHYLDQEDELFRGFVTMLAHDALIGVQDRHHQNWGVVVLRKVGGAAPRFSPLYDSARGLFCGDTDAVIGKYVGEGGSARIDGYVARSRPLVGFAGLTPRGGRKYVTHDQLLGAVFAAYPDCRPVILGVLDSYDWRAVRGALRGELSDMCSPRRRQLILTCLRRRLKVVRRAIQGS